LIFYLGSSSSSTSCCSSLVLTLRRFTLLFAFVCRRSAIAIGFGRCPGRAVGFVVIPARDALRIVQPDLRQRCSRRRLFVDVLPHRCPDRCSSERIESVTCWLQDIRGEGSKGGKALLAEFERPLLQWKSRLGEFVTLLYHAPAIELRYQCASISRSRCDRSAGSQLRFAADIPCITPRPAMYAFSAQRYCLSSLNSHTVLIFFEPGLGLDWESRGGKSDSGITIDQREVLHRQTPIIVHSSPEND